MGKKKAAALHGMTKAERRALEAREAELAAELARREKKAAKKAEGKKVEKAKPVKVKKAKATAPAPMTAEERKAKSPKATIAHAADKALATPSSEGARVAAETAAEAAAEATVEETDAQIKARIQAKRAARAAAETGVSSSLEGLNAIAEGRAPKAETVAKVDEAVKALRAEVEAVETEHGREFVAGVPTDHSIETTSTNPDDFASPSEAPKGDFETNGNNQYKVKRPSDGKVVGYTRATTYIANLEDRSMLEKWKMRLLLEGVGVHDSPDGIERGDIPEPVAARMRDLIHRRDVAIVKARKADRKGKLVTGQLATIVDAAWSDFKKATNALAEELLDLGGANEKSTKGTDLHALMELHDREGIDAVGDLLTEGKITPQDLADVEAYAEAVKKAGIRFDLIEQTVVNDELKVAGRLDRTALVKLPGMARATRCVADIKTGGIELGAGKLAQQLEMYAGSMAYDLDTDERVDMKLSRTKGIVIHVPQGTGTAFVYVVDLTLGRKGNKLSGEVRAWRNEGKRAVDFKTDLARPETFSMVEG